MKRKVIQEYLKSTQPEYNIGSGSVAEVYRAEVKTGEYCIKRKEHKSSKEAYEKEMLDEMNLQAQAFVIAREKAKTAEHVAKVPFPEFFVETTDGQMMIVMERINGKTLYRLLIEKVAKSIPEDKIAEYLPGVRKEEIEELPDKDLDALVIDGFFDARNKRGQMSESELDNYLRDRILRRLRKREFLPPQIEWQIANLLQAWKENNFYHRDLHEKNIMISADLSQVYIIDYGSSSYKEFSSAKDAYEVEVMGQQYLFFRDESVFQVLDQVIKK